MEMDIRLFYTGPMQVNTYLIADKTARKAAIVDPGGASRSLDQYIDSMGYDVEYILLTHGHGDHICGVPHYQEIYGAKIVGHHGDDYLFLDEKENLSKQFTGQKIVFTPDIYVEEMDTIKVGEIELIVLHTPGHTPGGICFLTDNIVFSGDTLFQQSIGRTDFKNGSFPQIKKSIESKLYTLKDDTHVLPGHMGQTTIGFEKKHNPFV